MLFTPAPQTIERRPALFTPTSGASALGGVAGPGKTAGLLMAAGAAPVGIPLNGREVGGGQSASSTAAFEPRAGLMHQFAQALEQWTLSTDNPTQVESHLSLLEQYEALCDREIAQLEAQLQQPADSAVLASLASECALLRGERSTWRLLRLMYADYGARQCPPPELPPPPEDWSAPLRKFGPPPPRLVPEEWNKRAADTEAGSGLSKRIAMAGIYCRSLHDAEVLQARVVASDAILDLGLRLKGWLEHAANDRVRLAEVDASMRRTRQRIEVRAVLSLGASRCNCALSLRRRAGGGRGRPSHP